MANDLRNNLRFKGKEVDNTMDSSYRSDDIDGPKPYTYLWGPNPDVRGPIGAYKAPIGTYRGPIGTYRAPIDINEAPIDTYRCHIGIFRAPIGNDMGPIVGPLQVPMGAL